MSDAHPDVLDLMDEFLGQVQTEKAAAAKDAATGNDPGGHQNQGTSHPVTSSDDGTVAATEGERSSENEADVKADYPGMSVEDNVDNPEGGSNKPSITVIQQAMLLPITNIGAIR